MIEEDYKKKIKELEEYIEELKQSRLVGKKYYLEEIGKIFGEEIKEKKYYALNGKETSYYTYKPFYHRLALLHLSALKILLEKLNKLTNQNEQNNRN